MLENIKAKKSLAAVVTLAFVALFTCATVDTYAAPTSTSVITGISASGSSSSTSTTTEEDDSDDESTIPDTSAGVTETNPETADDTWLYAFASLAITAAAIGGRQYFAKH